MAVGALGWTLVNMSSCARCRRGDGGSVPVPVPLSPIRSRNPCPDLVGWAHSLGRPPCARSTSRRSLDDTTDDTIPGRKRPQPSVEAAELGLQSLGLQHDAAEEAARLARALSLGSSKKAKASEASPKKSPSSASKTTAAQRWPDPTGDGSRADALEAGAKRRFPFGWSTAARPSSAPDGFHDGKLVGVSVVVVEPQHPHRGERGEAILFDFHEQTYTVVLDRNGRRTHAQPAELQKA